MKELDKLEDLNFVILLIDIDNLNYYIYISVSGFY